MVAITSEEWTCQLRDGSAGCKGVYRLHTWTARRALPLLAVSSFLKAATAQNRLWESVFKSSYFNWDSCRFLNKQNKMGIFQLIRVIQSLRMCSAMNSSKSVLSLNKKYNYIGFVFHLTNINLIYIVGIFFFLPDVYFFFYLFVLSLGILVTVYCDWWTWNQKIIT